MIKTSGFSRPDMAGVARRQLRLSVALIALVAIGLLGTSLASFGPASESLSAAAAKMTTLVRPG